MNGGIVVRGLGGKFSIRERMRGGKKSNLTDDDDADDGTGVCSCSQ